MKQRMVMRRFFSLLVALSFLLILLSCNGIGETDNDPLRDTDTHKVVACDACGFAETLCAEEELPSVQTGMIRNDTSRRPNLPKCFDGCVKGGSFLLFGAGILFVTLTVAYKALFGSHRSIIKYIHDQDGGKGYLYPKNQMQYDRYQMCHSVKEEKLLLL